MQRPVTLWGERQKVWDLEVLKMGRGKGDAISFKDKHKYKDKFVSGMSKCGSSIWEVTMRIGWNLT